ncbi:MAG: hypothetical protein HQL29_01555 [Candidatus Omnitrophica bacterium]|nr:hypothetical protein [Candidatus Omnitrophota bacterium]
MKEKKCDVEVFSRVTGFFRPVQTWNAGKTEEFKDRKRYLTVSMMEKQNEPCGVSENIAC